MALRIDLVEHGVRACCRLGTQLRTGLSARGTRDGGTVAAEVGILTDQELGSGDCVEGLVPSGTLSESSTRSAGSGVGGRWRTLSRSGPRGAAHNCAELGVLDPGEGAGLVGLEVTDCVFVVVHGADALPALGVAHLYACLDRANVLEDLVGWAAEVGACADRVRFPARGGRCSDLGGTRSDGRLRSSNSGEGDEDGESRLEAVESGHCWSSMFSNGRRVDMTAVERIPTYQDGRWRAREF